MIYEEQSDACKSDYFDTLFHPITQDPFSWLWEIIISRFQCCQQEKDCVLWLNDLWGAKWCLQKWLFRHTFSSNHSRSFFLTMRNHYLTLSVLPAGKRLCFMTKWSMRSKVMPAKVIISTHFFIQSLKTPFSWLWEIIISRFQCCQQEKDCVLWLNDLWGAKWCLQKWLFRHTFSSNHSRSFFLTMRNHYLTLSVLPAGKRLCFMTKWSMRSKVMPAKVIISTHFFIQSLKILFPDYEKSLSHAFSVASRKKIVFYD